MQRFSKMGVAANRHEVGGVGGGKSDSTPNKRGGGGGGGVGGGKSDFLRILKRSKY